MYAVVSINWVYTDDAFVFCITLTPHPPPDQQWSPHESEEEPIAWWLPCILPVNESNDTSYAGDTAQIAAEIWFDTSRLEAGPYEPVDVGDVSIKKAPTAVSKPSKAPRRKKSDLVPLSLESKFVRNALLCWAYDIKLAIVSMGSTAGFYPSLSEKKRIAKSLKISLTRVHNFCNNHRKRCAKTYDQIVSSVTNA
jgi:hypothetical protein